MKSVLLANTGTSKAPVSIGEKWVTRKWSSSNNVLSLRCWTIYLVRAVCSHWAASDCFKGKLEAENYKYTVAQLRVKVFFDSMTLLSVCHLKLPQTCFVCSPIVVTMTTFVSFMLFRPSADAEQQVESHFTALRQKGGVASGFLQLEKEPLGFPQEHFLKKEPITNSFIGISVL